MQFILRLLLKAIIAGGGKKAFGALLRLIGWKRIALLVWPWVYNKLKKAAKKTEYDFDDNAVEFVNKVLMTYLKLKK